MSNTSKGSKGGKPAATLPEGVDPLAELRRFQESLANARYHSTGKNGWTDEDRAHDEGARDAERVAGMNLAPIVTALEALVAELRGQGQWVMADRAPIDYAPTSGDTSPANVTSIVDRATGKVYGYPQGDRHARDRIAAGRALLNPPASLLSQALWLVERVNGDPETHPEEILAAAPWPSVRVVDNWEDVPGRWSQRVHRVYVFPDGSHAAVSWLRPNTENQDTSLEARASEVLGVVSTSVTWKTVEDLKRSATPPGDHVRVGLPRLIDCPGFVPHRDSGHGGCDNCGHSSYSHAYVDKLRACPGFQPAGNGTLPTCKHCGYKQILHRNNLAQDVDG